MRNPEFLKKILRISIFSKSIACLGINYQNKHGLKTTDIKWDFSGGQKNRGSSRVEGQSPQLEMIPTFFFKLIFFCLKSKSLAAPFFLKHLFIHGIVKNSACEWLGEDWYHNIVKIRCFRVAKSGVFKKIFADFNFL